MRENTDQNNSECEHFSRSEDVTFQFFFYKSTYYGATRRRLGIFGSDLYFLMRSDQDLQLKSSKCCYALLQALVY